MRQVFKNSVRLVMLTVFLTSCAATKPVTNPDLPDAELSEKAAPECENNCTQGDGADRYQYYLGILSVFILG